MDNITDVIILGAGASASEGAPLQNTLFSDYCKLCMGRSQETETYKMEERLRTFFKVFFGIEITHRSETSNLFPTFEEILGILELSLDRNESFRNLSITPNSPRVQLIRQDLIFSIAMILDKKLGVAENDDQGHHSKLIRRLAEQKQLRRTAFISLNYDILIDNALANIYPSYDLEYGVEFTNFNAVDDWKRPRPNKSIHLLKLHGSLNWLFCPTCISLTLTPKVKKVATLVYQPVSCDSCNSEMTPVPLQLKLDIWGC